MECLIVKMECSDVTAASGDFMDLLKLIGSVHEKVPGSASHF